MTELKYRRLQIILDILEDISKEYSDNTSLGTIICSVKARINHYKTTKCSTEENNYD